MAIYCDVHQRVILPIITTAVIIEFTMILCSPVAPSRITRDEKFVSSRSDKCYIPEAISTKFSWEFCSNFENCSALAAFTLVENNEQIFINCKNEFSRELDEGIHVISCENGIWQPPNVLCRPINYCQPVTSLSVEAKCEKDGETIDCEKNVRAGTKAKFGCKVGYSSVGEPIQDLEITCLATGEWSSSIPRCTQSCGIAPKWESKSSNTTKASKFNHPWNAAVYQNTTSLFHICGGTLISPFIVVSVASCFHDYNRKLKSASEFMVGLGKEHREINHPDDLNTSQIFHVKKIYPSKLYESTRSGYFGDITVLELSEPAVLSDAVMPACLDMTVKHAIAPFTAFSIAGWDVLPGEIDGERYDDYLTQVHETYLSYEDCLTELRKTRNERFLTSDKFCVVDRDNYTSIRRGFSGGGFLSEFDGKYYLHGIMSNRGQNHFNFITDVKYEYNLNFLKDRIKEINKAREQLSKYI